MGKIEGIKAQHDPHNYAAKNDGELPGKPSFKKMHTWYKTDEQ